MFDNRTQNFIPFNTIIGYKVLKTGNGWKKSKAQRYRVKEKTGNALKKKKKMEPN